MGYLIIAGQALLLVVLAVSVRRSCPRNGSNYEYIYAGGDVPSIVQMISMFSMWMWTTSILGATEAGINYGLPGCAAYAIGADAGFILMSHIIRHARRKYGAEFFLMDFIRDRFSDQVSEFFFVICILMSAYTAVQQIVGFSNVFSTLWGISYKVLAVLVAIMVVIFVVVSGMRGVLLGDVVFFFVIVGSLVLMAGLIAGGSESHIFYDGVSLMLEDFKDNTQIARAYPFLQGLISYIIVMGILGTSETILDPTFYVKANLTKSENQMKRIFWGGGVVLWTPIVILTSTMLSSLWRAKMGRQLLESSNTNLLTRVLFSETTSDGLRIVFSVLIASVVVTTIANEFMSVLAVMTLRGHREVTGDEGSDREKSNFGIQFTLMLALFCGLITLSLDNISLFVINIVCGIFFAAPCGIVLFFRVDSKQDYFPVISVFVGIVAGIFTWLKMDNSQYSLLFGTMVSFTVPYGLNQLSMLFLGRGASG